MSEGIQGQRVVHPREVCAYPYTDAQGNTIYEKVRTDPKGFYHRRRGPGGLGYCYSLSEGWYVWRVNRWVGCDKGTEGAVWFEGVRKVPYQWLDLRKRENHPVLVVEGEKSAKLLSEIGYVSICSPDGAGKWPVDFGGYLARRDVVVFPDNDEPGALHAAQVVGSAVLYGAKSFRIIKGGYHGYKLPEGGDIYDWLTDPDLFPASGGPLKQRVLQYEGIKKLVKKFPKMVWESGT